MSAPIITTKYSVDVAKTYASPITITGITKASPGVATSVAHGLLDGAIGVFEVDGMAELDAQIIRVTAKTIDTITLEGLDTTNYGAFTSGTFTPITAWDRYGDCNSFSCTQGSPAKIETTKSVDASKQYEYGLPDAPEIKLTGLKKATDGAAVTNLQAAARAGSARALKITFRNGTLLYVNCAVGGGEGFGGKENDKLTNEFQFSVKNLLQWF